VPRFGSSRPRKVVVDVPGQVRCTVPAGRLAPTESQTALVKRRTQCGDRGRAHAVQLLELGLGDLRQLIQLRVSGRRKRAARRSGEFRKARVSRGARVRSPGRWSCRSLSQLLKMAIRSEIHRLRLARPLMFDRLTARDA
jgi:hypothetical protein